jgi:hypothetical protein
MTTAPITKFNKAIHTLVEDASLSAVDKLAAFLDTQIEMDDDMKQLFTDFKTNLTTELKEAAKAPAATKASKKGNAPATKREPSAYNLFIKEQMAKIKAANPDMPAKELMKAATVEWKKAKEASTASSAPAPTPEPAPKAPATKAKK